jgi:hypothetical protein
MRFTRMLFALPIIAPMAAFTSFPAPVPLGYPPTVHEVVYSLSDLMVIPDAGHVAVLRRIRRTSVGRAIPYSCSRLGQPAAEQVALRRWRLIADHPLVMHPEKLGEQRGLVDAASPASMACVIACFKPNRTYSDNRLHGNCQ